jgi:hypothetical protein
MAQFQITSAQGRSVYSTGKQGIFNLYGYDDFIGEHKLLPLYQNTLSDLPGQGNKIKIIHNLFGYNQLPGATGSLRGGPGTPIIQVKQIYYYLSPFVCDNFIVENKLIFYGDHGTGGCEHDYIGYNGKKPTVKLIQPKSSTQSSKWQINADDKFGDKFLVFPQGGMGEGGGPPK